MYGQSNGTIRFDHNILFQWTLFRLIGQFSPVLALYDPFGVDVPLNCDIIITLKITQTLKTFLLKKQT